MPSMILTGDVNLMGVDDPRVPFARVRNEFVAADVVFSNWNAASTILRAVTRSRTKASSPPRASQAKRYMLRASPPSASRTM
jgi:hypothetical protein